MNNQINGETSVPVVPISYLVNSEKDSNKELEALRIVSDQYTDGLLTIDEAMRTMEGRQIWQ